MTVDLIIAGRRIRLRSEDGITLLPDERFRAFIAAAGKEEAGDGRHYQAQDGETGRKEAGADGQGDSGEPELTVDIFPGKAAIPPDALKVFDARLMEETPDGPRDSGEPFWEILSGDGVTWAKVFLKDPVRNPVLVMPHGKMTWQIYADMGVSQAGQNSLYDGGNAKEDFPDSSDAIAVNPLPYPVDGLLLWFLSSAMGDIMMHGSGVVCGDRGWIFTGRSGSGKTTIAGIFDRAGDRVIHDDRLILRREAGGWVMHSTPVYRNDEPRSAGVDHLWAISHGTSNISTPVTGAGAVAMVLSNCIQQNWNRAAASRLAASVEELASEVKISSLTFLPDNSIRDYLEARESDSFVTAAGVASAILAEEKEVTITAGGYSMWPAIRPGDRIVIMPYDPQVPLAQGMIVALRRDGGFVVHRVTDYRRGEVTDFRRGKVPDYRRGKVTDDRESKGIGSRRGEVTNFIRTRGDTAMICDPWIPASDVAGLVKRLTEDGEMKIVSRRSMPYFMGSIAVALIKIFSRIRRRF